MSIKHHSNENFLDNNKLTFGTGDDLQLYHSGTNSFITNAVGDINIINHTDNGDIKFQADDGSGGDTLYFAVDGGISKTKFSLPALFIDNKSAEFGTDSDMLVFHSGSNGEISNNSKQCRR